MRQVRVDTTTLFRPANSSHVLSTLVVALTLLVAATHGYGATFIWTNSSSGDFGNAANWNTNVAPTSGNATMFTNETTYTVSFSANFANMASSTFTTGKTGVVTLDLGAFSLSITDQFNVGRASSTATVYLASGKLTVANGNAGEVRIGDGLSNAYFSAGTFIVTNGVVSADQTLVGASTNASGTLIISGPNAVWTNTVDSGTVTVGTRGMGSSLIISNGGKLFATSLNKVGEGAGASNSFALLSDTGSMWTNTQYTRIGGANAIASLLMVSNGAKMFSNGGTIGANSSYNTGVVVGAGSAWYAVPLLANNGSIIIGTSGSGGTNNNLSVRDGGLLFCAGSISVSASSTSLSNSFEMGGIGALSTGILNVVRFDSSGSRSWINMTNAWVTTSGACSIQGASNSVSVLSNATWVMSTNLAFSSSAVGCLLTINGGYLTNAQAVNVASGAIGNRMSIINGGRLASGLSTIGSSSAMNTGIVDGVGSFWSNGSNLVIGTGGTITTGNGTNTLIIQNGGSLLNAGSLNVGNSPTTTVNTVSFGGTGVASTVTIQGVLYVGHNSSSNNTLTITNVTANCTTIHVGNDTVASPNYTFTTNDGAMLVTNFCMSTNDLVATIITNCDPTITPASVGNLLRISSGTLTGGLVRVHGTNTLIYTAGTLGFTTLRVDGNMLGTATVDVPNGSTLEGAGSVANPVTVENGGIVAPGTSVGTLTISNNVTLNNSSVLSYELGSTGSADKLVVVGNLTLDGVLNVTTNNTDGLFGVGNYTLITYTGTLTDNGLSTGTMPTGLNYVIVAGGGSVVLQVTAVVSDPYTAWATHYFPSGGPNSLGNADPDFDGVNNTNEFLSGFNPTNAVAYAHVISIAKQSGNMNVTYLGASGDDTWSPGIGSRTNILEFTTGTANGSYSNNFATTGQTNILSGGHGLGTVTNMIDTGGATGTTRYYRIRVLAP